MDKNTFNPKEIIFSLDIGTRSIIGTVGVVRDKKFEVLCERYQEHEERAMVDGQIHDINLVAKVVDDVKKQIEKELNIKLEQVSIAAAGRFLKTCNARADMNLNGEVEIDKEIIRSIELSAVKKAEEEINKNTAGKLYSVGYTIKEYFLNSYVISNLLGHKGEEVGAEVIATFLPRSVIDSLYTVMNKVGLKVMNLTLEPIAAIEAAVPKNLRLLNIALVDIGAGTSDIAISSKETISAYAMVPMAGDEVTEVIAQEYLVDFNTAEEIKRKIKDEENITYTDVIGFENTISSEAVRKVIEPTVNKIAEAIGTKIIEINGGKSPAAVFLVGGGAHTPGLLERVSESVNVPMQRIAIKDRQAVTECIAENNLGPAGVTVLGIALSAIKSLGNDFIDVTLNGEVISLFNSHKHTVMDVLLQAGINPKLLIGRAGKNIRFSINGKKRLAFGAVGKNAVIKVNSLISDLEKEVKEGDSIEIEFAQNGKDAAPSVSEYVEELNTLSILVDEKIINIEPICLVNNKNEGFEKIINDGDEIKIISPNTVALIKEYILQDVDNLYKDEVLLEDDYIVMEGEILISKYISNSVEVNAAECNDIEALESKVSEVKDVNSIDSNTLMVIVNEKEVLLKGKESYIFVDIFNEYEFDLTVPKGNIVTKLNGEDASYVDKLKAGDVIEVYWN